MNLISFEELARLFKDASLDLSEEQYVKLLKYADMLVEWNEKINLTAITDPEGIATKHFLDSVLPLTMFSLPQNARVIDVGTGAGFPGIPMKIMRDDIDLTLMDSLNKRVSFLSEVCGAIGISADCTHERAEDSGKGEKRERFDIATARAVAKLSVLAEYCLPFVKVGGAFAALKGADCKEEIKASYTAIKTLGGKTEQVIEYTLPTGDKRTLVIIRKIAPTPKAYPRPKGKMNKKPL
ncbi:MAG: 16S rRNA (guanine(527)-N(7))-methyltransferase RsmG [Oscillospiraceae bacterium]|nr:16S rRNA (guanine(527)-N(7))-methyltransferase RsmG [Oscillospiraceae bacterium]